MPDLGPYELDITTSSRAAASAFNRGLNHCFNFNQPMALEAFAECASLDPGCAMCHWGTAYAFGPFLNQPRKPVAHLLGGREAASRAHDLATAPGSKLTSKERGLVEAMFLRYPETPTGDIPVQEYTAFEV